MEKYEISKDSLSYPFYIALKQGKSINRRDHLNLKYQVITLDRLNGDASLICLFGYMDLTIN